MAVLDCGMAIGEDTWRRQLRGEVAKRSQRHQRATRRRHAAASGGRDKEAAARPACHAPAWAARKFYGAASS